MVASRIVALDQRPEQLSRVQLYGESHGVSHDAAFNQRPALGQSGSLGDLYDARNDSILPRSILKLKEPPLDSLQTSKIPGPVNYKWSSSDSLEDKLSKLDIHANLGVNILAGQFSCDLAANFIMKKKSKDHHRQTSIFCDQRTEVETLCLDRLGTQSLNLDSLQAGGATHVITKIAWGARTIVTAKTTKKVIEEGHDLGGKPPSASAARKARIHEAEAAKEVANVSRQSETSTSGEPNSVEDDRAAMSVGFSKENKLTSMMMRLFDVQISGGIQYQNLHDRVTEDLDLEIITDVTSHHTGHLPTTYEGALEFINNLPAGLQNINSGKGVPVIFYLTPISEVAALFNITLKHDIIVKRLDQSLVDNIVKQLDRSESTCRKFNDYAQFIQEHAYCVPKDHIKKTQKRADNVEGRDRRLREDLGKIVKGIRYNNGDPARLNEWLNKLHDSDSDSDSDSDDEASSLEMYRDKIAFADAVRVRGAIYIKNGDESLNHAITAEKTKDIFILRYAESSRADASWLDNRQRIIDLLDDNDDQVAVYIEDFDVKKAASSVVPSIKQYRGGTCIVEDVVEDMRDLASKNIVRCNNAQKVDRSRSIPLPAARRLVRIKCPGVHCFNGEKFKWTCARCRGSVFYGFTDEFFYCQCSRYPFIAAEFKCKGHEHGHEWATHEAIYLQEQLENLQQRREYNILILGKTGVGKSTFINAFQNYVNFDTLDEALQADEPLQWQTPSHFAFESVSNNIPGGSHKHKLKINVNLGIKEPIEQSESLTRTSDIFSFPIGDDAVLRFIDTPGMGDTRGIKQDLANVKDILKTLEGVQKLSGVLFLLEAGVSRATEEFKFCMTELLHNLHNDAMKNVLFGYTKIGITPDVAGAQASLTSVLDGLKTGISLNDDNQFRFDSAAFKYLAACKTHGAILPQKEIYSTYWNDSVHEAGRLISIVEQLKVHDVRKTLCFHRISSLLENMAKPLTEFASCMHMTETSLQAARASLENASTQNHDFEKTLSELKVEKYVPIRETLAKPRLVCGHATCFPKTTICHDKCDLNVPDDEKPNKKVEDCYAFRKYLFWHNGPCRVCGHGYADHMRQSYSIRHEKQPLNQENISRYNELLKMGMSEKEAFTRTVKYQEAKLEAIKNEEVQVKDAQAKFGVYIGTNAMIQRKEKRRDATEKYLAMKLEHATTPEEVEALEKQMSVLKEKMRNLEEAIRNNEAEVPSEEDIENTLDELKRMENFGEYLNQITVDSNDVRLEGREIVTVPVRSGKTTWSRKGLLKKALQYIG